jgi:Domain of unknown function DUF29
MATKPAELYDTDFYAWAQQQAQALRTHSPGDNRLDVEHLAEAVEDLGTSELHAVEPGIRRRLPPTNPYDWKAIERHEDVRVLLAEQEAAATAPKLRAKGRKA